MAKRKNNQVTMRDIRRVALVLATKEYTRVNTALWTTNPREFNVYHLRKLINYCLKKEYDVGVHDGATNPYA